MSRTQLLALLQQNQIGLQTLIWQEGWPDWQPLERTSVVPTPPPVSRVGSVPPPPPPTYYPSSPPTAQLVTASQKKARHSAPLIIAGLILALLLGAGLQWVLQELLSGPELAAKATSIHTSPNLQSDGASTVSEASSFEATLERATGASTEQVGQGTTPPLSSVDPVDSDLVAFEPSADEPLAGETEGEVNPTATSQKLRDQHTSPTTSAEMPADADNRPGRSPDPENPLPVKNPELDYRVFQEVQIQRLPQFSVAGQIIGQDLRYKILSEIQVSRPDDRGHRTVDQVIVATHLVNADPMSKDSLAKSLKDLEGWQFSAKLNSHGGVIEWNSGPKPGRSVLEVKPKDLTGFLMTHVMDEDGWKELTQLSFFRPDPAAAQDGTWEHQMTHDFGSLGHWSGMTRYQRGDQKEKLTLFNYTHDLEYFPPTEEASDLPFDLVDVKFRSETAEGRIYYDEASDRVAGVEETFVLRGTLAIELLGQLANVETSEQQALVIMLTPDNPWRTPK